jgi:HSP20 family protein
MERVLDRIFGPWGLDVPEEGPLTGAYPVDIREEDGTLLVDAEMPGFKREEIDVSIDNGVLRISAERRPEEPKGTSHLNERRYTRVERVFTLPKPVDPVKVEAKLDGGVLHLELAESEESRPKRIEVK